MDTRKKFRQQLDEHWLDMYRKAQQEKKRFAVYCQEQSPPEEKEYEQESDNALGSWLEANSVYLRGNKELGVAPSSMDYILADDCRALMWFEGTQEDMFSKMRGYTELSAAEHRAKYEMHLATTYTRSDRTPGGGYRAYMDTAQREGYGITVWPPLSSVAAMVDTSQSDVIRVLEVNEPDQLEFGGSRAQPWIPGTPIPLWLLNEAETPVTTRWLAGGYQIGSFTNLNSQHVMFEADRFRIDVEQQIVDELLTKINTGITSEDIGLSGHSYNSRDVIQMAMHYKAERKKFQITTGIGNSPTVEAWLDIDRSGFRFDAGGETPAGGMVGGDMYGGAGMMRMWYDVTAPTIADDELVTWDAGMTADVYIVAGSDTSAEETIQRIRGRQVSWTIKFGTTLRTPDTGGEPRVKFT